MSDPPMDKVYLSDPYKVLHQTQVVNSRHEGGSVWIRLNETIFYPENGGQSSDRGTINDLPVNDVKMIDDQIWHQLSEELPEKVILKLDWNRRYTNMQQHTGQHILSACFKNELNIDTVSVHLGTSDTMIELDTPGISDKQSERIQIKANEIIRHAYPVSAMLVTQKDLIKYPVRRDVKHLGHEIRLVVIGDYDCTACGGTHVRNTAEVGLIKIIAVQNIRKHARVVARIGQHAYTYFDVLDKMSRMLAAKLSSGVSDLPAKISSLTSDMKKLRYENKKITEKWLELLAEQLPSQPDLGFFELDDVTVHDLQYISSIWLDRNNVPCYFVAPGKKDGQFNFVLRTPTGSSLDGFELIRQLADTYGLKGGGRKEFVNGVMFPKKWDAENKQRLRKALADYINKHSG